MSPWLAVVTVAAATALVVSFAWRPARALPPGLVWSGRGVMLAAWLGVVALTTTLERPPDALVEADLAPGNGVLVVPARTHGSLLVSAELPPEAAEHDVSSHYHLSVWDGSHRVQRLDGTLGETRKSVRIARGRGSTQVAKIHDRERVDLVPSPADHPLRVEVDEISGTGPQHLHAALIPQPPSLRVVAPLAMALLVLAVIADALAQRRTAWSLATGALGGVALLMLDLVPGLPVGDVLARLAVGAIVGVGVGALLRAIARGVFRPRGVLEADAA